MNPHLQQILHDITVRITKLEEANALEADPRPYGDASFRYGDHPTSFGLTKRTWVGLTEEEKIKLWDRAEKRGAYQGVPSFIALIQEVEAKLKEKNL